MSSKSKKSKKTDIKTSTIEEPRSDQIDRNLMISEAAYYMAEQRGFSPAQANEDWLEAGKQVEEMLSVA